MSQKPNNPPKQRNFKNPPKIPQKSKSILEEFYSEEELALYRYFQSLGK